MLSAGIVGLPNVGKSTLFNAVTRTRKAQAANYPFCTIEPNQGVVVVPDSRLDTLTKMSKSILTVPAMVEFVETLKKYPGNLGKLQPMKDAIMKELGPDGEADLGKLGEKLDAVFLKG